MQLNPTAPKAVEFPHIFGLNERRIDLAFEQQTRPGPEVDEVAAEDLAPVHLPPQKGPLFDGIEDERERR